MTRNVYLVGFMGAGKSTVGRLLAEALHRRFVDLDARLVAHFGMPVAQVFGCLGEEAFRLAETRELRRLAGESRLVVAVGGGAVAAEANRRLMARAGRVVHLAAGLATCRARLTEAELAARPMWRDEARAAALYQARQAWYGQAELTLDTEGLSAPEAAQALVGRLFPEVVFPVRLEGRASSVTATFAAPAALEELLAGRRAAVLADRRAWRLHGPRYAQILGDAPVFLAPPGERAKSLAVAGRVYEWLLTHRFGRDDALVALGGGVVTDLGAFVAATFKRGLGSILVATTLLGQADAAVGGKAAVNLPAAKNAVGCFTAPLGVIQDSAALATLGRERLAEGLVEAYKTGLVAAPDLARLIEANLAALLGRDLPALRLVAAESARAKAAVVGRDPAEAGERMILNLGHTYGHAVEAWRGYRVAHGRAVAVGLEAAVAVSVSRGLLPPAEADRIRSVLARLVPRRPELPPPAAAWELMGHDKKIRRGRLLFVLLQALGAPVLVDDVTLAELAAASAQLGGA